MPLEQLNQINDHTRWALWEIKEDLESLFEKIPDKQALQLELNGIVPEKIKLEKAATRVCLKYLAENSGLPYHGILKNKCGKPFLRNTTAHISVSHSFPYIAAILDLKSPTGIDIQDLGPKLNKIASRFLNKNEFTFCSDSTEKIGILWCAKETLYKIQGRNSISFRNDLEIKPFELNRNGTIIGVLRENNRIRSYQLEYTRINHYIVVYKKT